jgi:hypothetical protein
MHGDLTVQAGSGTEGSRFTLRLPLADQAGPAGPAGARNGTTP